MGHRAVFTHNDLDGLVSALLARVALPDADFYFCDYNSLARLVTERVDRYEVFWFVDLSIRDEAMFTALREADCECYWFDHHASSLRQDWMRECRIDDSGERCAAEVVFEYVVEQGYAVPTALQTLTEYAHDQDLWVRQMPEAQSFNDILGHMGVFDLFQVLSEDLSRVYHWTTEMREASEATAAERHWSLRLAKETSVVADLPDGKRLRAACCWGSASEIGDEIGDDDTLVALIDLRAIQNGNIKCSLRTRSDEIPANRIAERLGGGGHPRASGAPLDLAILRALTAELLDKVLAAADHATGEARCG